MDGGAGLGVLLGVIAVAFLIGAVIAGAFMWVGAKIARIQPSGFLRSMGAAVAAAFASSLVTLILALMGLPRAGAFVGILVSLFVIKLVYGTTFFKALICWIGYVIAAVVAWIAAAVLVAGGAVAAAGGAKALAARASMASIRSALEDYRRDAGVLPSTDQGLRALLAAPATEPRPRAWKGPYVKGDGASALVDPWGRPYAYRGPATPGGDVILYSKGPDGADGTADDVK